MFKVKKLGDRIISVFDFHMLGQQKTFSKNQSTPIENSTKFSTNVGKIVEF